MWSIVTRAFRHRKVTKRELTSKFRKVSRICAVRRRRKSTESTKNLGRTTVEKTPYRHYISTGTPDDNPHADSASTWHGHRFVIHAFKLTGKTDRYNRQNRM
ncbi:hypothetical protein PUN28_000099 [Cardiocondyla obscurior]|uniref:Uncharacterized protein n=1 Tax=Cardiocondyla obscurior TaxID=286306 RepID=A0AAW2GXQ2_9HYME